MAIGANEKDRQVKLIQLVNDIIKRDEALRKQYLVGDKFRFIPERLNALLATLETSLQITSKEKKPSGWVLSAEEVPVFVYLYNAQGLVLRSWLNMLTPKVFYEYSVNRPIYRKKSQVDLLLKSKKNKMQHAYLTIAVRPMDILTPEGNVSQKEDESGTIRVKEGSLLFEKLLTFTHNGQEYTMNEGEFVKLSETR